MGALRKILVFGATGKQGGALIRSLIASPPSNPFELVAVTRNAESPSAKSLAEKSNVSILQGDFNDIDAIFKKAGSVYGVFSVQTPLNHVKEEKDGKALAELAAKNGVEHFVYASVDRGGEGPTVVPHFASKFHIEQHIKAVAAQTNGRMRWTVIRPVAFMENLTPDFFGRVFGSSWRMTGRKMQIVSTPSIGILAAEAFRVPETYHGLSINLATDSLSFDEANAIFKKQFGRDMPNTYDFVARIIHLLAWKQFGIMFKWIKEEGFGANPDEYKSRFPGMQDFSQWLEQSSKFRND